MDAAFGKVQAEEPASEHATWSASGMEWNPVTMEGFSRATVLGGTKRRRGAPAICQAPNCGIDLSEAKAYFKRHMICATHMKVPSMMIKGVKMRYCQQCGHFEPLTVFVGANRSCKMSLERRSAIAQASKRKASRRKSRDQRQHSSDNTTSSEHNNNMLDDSMGEASGLKSGAGAAYGREQSVSDDFQLEEDTGARSRLVHTGSGQHGDADTAMHLRHSQGTYVPDFDRQGSAQLSSGVRMLVNAPLPPLQQQQHPSAGGYDAALAGRASLPGLPGAAQQHHSRSAEQLGQALGAAVLGAGAQPPLPFGGATSATPVRALLPKPRQQSAYERAVPTPAAGYMAWDAMPRSSGHGAATAAAAARDLQARLLPQGSSIFSAAAPAALSALPEVLSSISNPSLELQLQDIMASVSLDDGGGWFSRGGSMYDPSSTRLLAHADAAAGSGGMSSAYGPTRAASGADPAAAGAPAGGGGGGGGSLVTCMQFLQQQRVQAPLAEYGGYGRALAQPPSGGEGTRYSATEAPDPLVRVAIKLTSCAPDELDPTTVASLRRLLSVYDSLQNMQGYVRPGCTHLIVDAYAPNDVPGSTRAEPAADVRALLAQAQVAEALRDIALRNNTRLTLQMEDTVVPVERTGTVGEPRRVPMLPTIVAASRAAVSTVGIDVLVTLYGAHLDGPDIEFWARMHGVFYRLKAHPVSDGGVSVRLPPLLHCGLLHLEASVGATVGPSYPLLVLPTAEAVAEVHTLAARMPPSSLRRFVADMGIALGTGAVLSLPINGLQPVRSAAAELAAGASASGPSPHGTWGSTTDSEHTGDFVGAVKPLSILDLEPAVEGDESAAAAAAAAAPPAGQRGSGDNGRGEGAGVGIGGRGRIMDGDPTEGMTNADDEQVVELLLNTEAVRRLLASVVALLSFLVERSMPHCIGVVAAALTDLQERFPDRVRTDLAPPLRAGTFSIAHAAARSGDVPSLLSVSSLCHVLGDHCSLVSRGAAGVTPLHLLVLLPEAPRLLSQLERLQPSVWQLLSSAKADDAMTPMQLFEVVHLPRSGPSNNASGAEALGQAATSRNRSARAGDILNPPLSADCFVRPSAAARLHPAVWALSAVGAGTSVTAAQSQPDEQRASSIGKPPAPGEGSGAAPRDAAAALPGRAAAAAAAATSPEATADRGESHAQQQQHAELDAPSALTPAAAAAGAAPSAGATEAAGQAPGMPRAQGASTAADGAASTPVVAEVQDAAGSEGRSLPPQPAQSVHDAAACTPADDASCTGGALEPTMLDAQDVQERPCNPAAASTEAHALVADVPPAVEPDGGRASGALAAAAAAAVGRADVQPQNGGVAAPAAPAGRLRAGAALVRAAAAVVVAVAALRWATLPLPLRAVLLLLTALLLGIAQRLH